MQHAFAISITCVRSLECMGLAKIYALPMFAQLSLPHLYTYIEAQTANASTEDKALGEQMPAASANKACEQTPDASENEACDIDDEEADENWGDDEDEDSAIKHASSTHTHIYMCIYICMLEAWLPDLQAQMVMWPKAMMACCGTQICFCMVACIFHATRQNCRSLRSEM